jgi:hypothetical protein
MHVKKLILTGFLIASGALLAQSPTAAAPPPTAAASAPLANPRPPSFTADEARWIKLISLERQQLDQATQGFNAELDQLKAAVEADHPGYELAQEGAVVKLAPKGEAKPKAAPGKK